MNFHCKMVGKKVEKKKIELNSPVCSYLYKVHPLLNTCDDNTRCISLNVCNGSVGMW